MKMRLVLELSGKLPESNKEFVKRYWWRSVRCLWSARTFSKAKEKVKETVCSVNWRWDYSDDRSHSLKRKKNLKRVDDSPPVHEIVQPINPSLDRSRKTKKLFKSVVVAGKYAYLLDYVPTRPTKKDKALMETCNSIINDDFQDKRDDSLVTSDREYTEEQYDPLPRQFDSDKKLEEKVRWCS